MGVRMRVGIRMSVDVGGDLLAGQDNDGLSSWKVNSCSTYLWSNITYIEIRHKIAYLFNAFYHGRGDDVDRHMKYVKFHFYDLLYAHIF